MDVQAERSSRQFPERAAIAKNKHAGFSFRHRLSVLLMDPHDDHSAVRLKVSAYILMDEPEPSCAS